MPRHTPGNYVPLDVNYVRDAAIRRAGEAAELLFIRSLAYAKGAKTKGRIPDYDLDVIAVGMKNVPARVAALVAHSLWIEGEGGWEIRSWAQWNSANEHESDAGRKAAHVRHHVNAGVRSQDCSYCDSDAIASAVVDAPAPESLMQGKGREGKGRTTSVAEPRGSRLPDDFAITDSMRAWASTEAPNVFLDREHIKFRDYWAGVAGAKGRKADWGATWRNWMRRASDDAGPRAVGQSEIDVNPWITR